MANNIHEITSTRSELPSLEVPLTVFWPLTLTYDPREQWPWSLHMQMTEVKGDSVQKIEWKQTDGETDEGDCIAFRTNAVCNKTSLLTVTWQEGRVAGTARHTTR